MYEFDGDENAEWVVDKKMPIVLYFDPENNKHIKLKWNSSYSG